MPITKNAKKAHAQSERRKVFNIRRKSALKDVTKKIDKSLSAGDAATAEALVPTAYKAIDKAAKRGIIKENTAARKKSRLAVRVGKAKA
jgi:small subunit ribosomal protein S20